MAIKESVASEFRRKSFHLLGLIYVAGFLALSRQMMILVLGLALAAALAIEVLRLSYQPMNDWLFRRCGSLFREAEKRKFTGALWMLLGIIWIALFVESTTWAVTICLYLLLGDTAASLMGRWIRGPTLWRSNKTVIGSVACFSVCLLTGILIFQSYHPRIILSALAATIGESEIVPINDNFAIPFFASLLTI